MGRKRTACQRCAAIKSLCNKEQPCSRCRRLSLSCDFNDLENSTHKPEIQQPSRHVRTRSQHKRSTKGCLSCLTRRKKCDEQKPTCGDCLRLGLACIPRNIERDRDKCHSTLGEGKQAASSSLESDIPSDSNSEDQLQLSYGAISWEPKTGLPLKERTHNPSISYIDWMAVIDDESRPELVRQNTLNKSSAMVVHKRSSEDYPSLATLLPMTALNNLTGVTSGALEGWTQGEKHLLNHFLQVVSRALVVVDDDENPFLLHVVPLALTDLSVRHSLVALAACHLSKVYPDFRADILHHQSLALQGLKQDLIRHDGVESLLSATLLLCLLEGTSRKWLLHLHGARALLKKASIEVGESLICFMYDLYEFICSITGTMLGNPSSATALSSPIFYYGPKAAAPTATKIHPLCGIAEELYKALYEINDLATRRNNRRESTENETAFLEKCTEIELKLQGWTPDAKLNNSKAYREITAAGLAFQWATLMRLHQVLHGNDVTHPKIQPAVEKILSALSIIRPGSKIEAHILFPLFMAGVGSRTKANRLTVEYRLNIMETTIGFGNITGAHQLLDNLWQRANAGEENVDWELLMQQEYTGVVLL